jgi:hypothetical protein
MQNIDPLYFISPIAILALSFGLVVYWSQKRSFSKWVLVYSLAAYAGAILLKEIVQIPTINAVQSASGNNPAVLGFYYGIQTASFEVGGAFLVASYAVSRGHLKARDAGGFGLGLAMWENGVLIGIPLLLNYIVEFSVLGTPNSSYAQTLYSDLTKGAPSLFYGPSGALPLIGYSILERISSLFAHFSWGLLAVLAAVYKKRIYIALVLPVGFLIDFLVPFSPGLGTGHFELIVFLIGTAGLVVSLFVANNARRDLEVKNSPAMPCGDSSSIPVVGAGEQSASLGQRESLISLGALSSVNFRRSITYGRVYLILGLALSLIIVIGTSVLPTTPTTTQYIASQGQALGIHNSVALIIVSIFPLLSPLLTVVGALGALMIFASDKAKGVYEYLISYGVDTSTIYWSIIISAAGLVTIVLGISVPVVTMVLFAINRSLPFQYVELILVYTIPLSYAATIFMTMVAMIWTSLTTRRTGMNSPVGIAPLFGILPVVVVLLLSETLAPAYLTLLTGGVTLALIGLVALMIAVVNKKMVRERFISSG